MGKPRMIILVRHAQSEGNKNREIHQMVPDHRVKLTPEGQQQAEEAGRRLRSMLKPDDTIRVFTSPYRRTRETTEGILKSLTDSSEDQGPSPFSRHAIKVYEEPRLREQDFGNFQPCSAEMERMWGERADYGHFFYRIPNGESAADAYDRVSGFNESLWRAFGEDDFPSVCILVTHGLMTRVFLMKWYHWSVEYFEDLRNINHCEFVIMKRDRDNGKYILENKLRTWSELKRKATINSAKPGTSAKQQTSSPAIQPRQWGGCPEGCKHDHASFPRRTRTKSSAAAAPKTDSIPPQDVQDQNDKEDHPLASQVPSQPPTFGLPSPELQYREHSSKDSQGSSSSRKQRPADINLPLRPRLLSATGRDGGGSLSGAATPAEGLSDSEDVHGKDYFIVSRDGDHLRGGDASTNARANAHAKRRPTIEDLENWKLQSGMGSGARADALGDDPTEDEEEDDDDENESRDGHWPDHDGGIVTPGPGAMSDELRQVHTDEARDKSLRGSVY